MTPLANTFRVAIFDEFFEAFGSIPKAQQKKVREFLQKFRQNPTDKSINYEKISSFADPTVLKANNITLCNSPGCNRHAVSEWIVFMILESHRHLRHYINTDERLTTPLPPSTTSLAGRRVTVLGKGNIGRRVAAGAQPDRR